MAPERETRTLTPCSDERRAAASKMLGRSKAGVSRIISQKGRARNARDGNRKTAALTRRARLNDCFHVMPFPRGKVVLLTSFAKCNG